MNNPIIELNLREFCEAAALLDVHVIEIVEHGILEPHGAAPRIGVSLTTNWSLPGAPQAAARIGIGMGRRCPGAGPARGSATVAR